MKNIVKFDSFMHEEGIYEPSININGKIYGCWALSSETSIDGFAGAIEELADALVGWINRKDNHGLLFHVCGDDLQAQKEFAAYFKEKYAVDVF